MVPLLSVDIFLVAHLWYHWYQTFSFSLLLLSVLIHITFMVPLNCSTWYHKSATGVPLEWYCQLTANSSPLLSGGFAKVSFKPLNQGSNNNILFANRLFRYFCDSDYFFWKKVFLFDFFYYLCSRSRFPKWETFWRRWTEKFSKTDNWNWNEIV